MPLISGLLSKASQSDPGGRRIKLVGSNHIVVLQCCVNTQAYLGYMSTKRKPKAIGTLAASFSC
jgi:hypothetical protein